MSKLVSRRGSHLLAYLLLGLLLSVADQRGILLRAGFGWLVDGAALVAGPITATLTQSVEWAGIEGFLRPLLLTLLYAGLLFALAIGLFRSKDLLWTE
jgi:hypothetical protein